MQAIDVTQHLKRQQKHLPSKLFYTVRPDDKTDVSSCNMEDCNHLVGVTEDSRMKPDWKSSNGFK